MIECVDVNKKIKGRLVLNHINFKVEEGSFYGLSGTNGSGKTMLLRLLCGLIQPTSGKVLIERPLSYGVIIETPGFLYNETGFHNLRYLAEINHKIGDKEILECLEKVGLAEKKDVKVSKYSLGMVQKLAIAQAVMEKPDILLLDEPFNALDDGSVVTVKQLLKELNQQGMTVLIAGHNLSMFSDLCHSVFKMEEGVLSQIPE